MSSSPPARCLVLTDEPKRLCASNRTDRSRTWTAGHRREGRGIARAPSVPCAWSCAPPPRQVVSIAVLTSLASPRLLGKGTPARSWCLRPRSHRHDMSAPGRAGALYLLCRAHAGVEGPIGGHFRLRSTRVPRQADAKTPACRSLRAGVNPPEAAPQDGPTQESGRPQLLLRACDHERRPQAGGRWTGHSSRQAKTAGGSGNPGIMRWSWWSRSAHWRGIVAGTGQCRKGPCPSSTSR